MRAGVNIATATEEEKEEWSKMTRAFDGMKWKHEFPHEDDYRKREYKLAERVADFYTALITEEKISPDVALELTKQYFAALLEQGVGQ